MRGKQEKGRIWRKGSRKRNRKKELRGKEKKLKHEREEEEGATYKEMVMMGGI